jgi:hypothetical protein
MVQRSPWRLLGVAIASALLALGVWTLLARQGGQLGSAGTVGGWLLVVGFVLWMIEAATSFLPVCYRAGWWLLLPRSWRVGPPFLPSRARAQLSFRPRLPWRWAGSGRSTSWH